MKEYIQNFGEEVYCKKKSPLRRPRRK